MFIVGDSSEVVVYDLASKTVVNRAAIHTNRIKDMALIDCKSMHPDLKVDSMLPNEQWLVTASSDGFIKVVSYDFDNVSFFASFVFVSIAHLPSFLAQV